MFARIRPLLSLLLIFLATFARSQSPQPAPASSAAVPPLPADIPASAERYSYIMMGNLAGQQAIWTDSDGAVHFFFQFNDRGRGPKIYSILKLDPSGLPLSETITGNDYLKSPVDETFTNTAGTAHWKSSAEHGEKKISASAYYSAINGAPAEIALLAQAALRNGGKIALLPEGEARIQHVTALDIEVASQKKHVALYSIAGLDFAPTYVWLEEGANAQPGKSERNANSAAPKTASPQATSVKFFATAEAWGAAIPEGWESAVKTLSAAQEKVKQSRSAEIAAKLAHHPPHGILFQHANVFDAESGKLIADQTVLVRDNRIAGIGTGALGSFSGTPPQIIDATGKTLLPGLWDMHAHVGDDDGLLNLASGVTTVRDLGNDTDTLLARRQRIIDGKEIGTRIVLAGFIDGNDAFHGPTKVLVSTEAEARAAVDNYKKLGYVQIKIYSSVPPALVPAIVDEAHKLGLRVSGHIPANMIAAQCVEDGYDEIQHVNFLILNFFPDVKNTNTIARLVKPAELGASLDLNSAQVRSFIKLLQDHHTKLDLTLNIFEDQIVSRAGEIPPGFLPVANRLPPQVRRSLLTIGMTPPPGMDETYKKSFAKMIDLAGLLYRSGLSIEAGTDAMAGFSFQRELELDVQAGIPPAVVLQNATLNAAKIMSMDKDLGSIAPGKLADLVLIDGDPTKNISDIRKTVVTVKDGVLYDPKELYSELGVLP